MVRQSLVQTIEQQRIHYRRRGWLATSEAASYTHTIGGRFRGQDGQRTL